MAADLPISINFMDLAIVGVMGYGAFKGYSDGLHEPIRRASIVVAALAAIRFYSFVEPFILNNVNVSPQLAPYVSGILVFLVLFLAINAVLSGMGGTITKYSKMSVNIDKGLGVVWGWIKWTFVLSFALMILGRMSLPPASLVSNSYLYDWTRTIGVTAVNNIFVNVPIVSKIFRTFEDAVKPAGTGEEVQPATPTQTVYTPSNTPEPVVHAPETNTNAPTTERDINNPRNYPRSNTRNTDIPPPPKPQVQVQTGPRKPPTVR